ncbi:hypothetical protein [Candidatus Odyssella acanthamoebae]|uniref:hypothetical protein n=1 Tax=Candidatus Odyssella acanthamoebae TaxID=91604 RepID=UPI0012EC3976|nr:hypothetical protein [Candidatus Paracaedibacter acanthamoebae]
MAYTDYRPQPVASSIKRRGSVPSVWMIMRSRVNDNTPGYFYWFSRILVASTVCFCVIEAIDYFL